MKKIKPPLICFLLQLMCSLFVTAQDSDNIDKFLTRVRSGSNEPLPSYLLVGGKQDTRTLAALQPFLKDSMASIRSKAIYIARHVGNNSSDGTVRHEAVDFLIKAAKDGDSGVRRNAIRALTSFGLADFSDQSKAAIGSMLYVKERLNPDLLKLAGYLDLKAYSSQIQKILQTEGPLQIKFAARIALCRMNDPAATEWLLNKLSKATITDDFVYDVIPDLIYTRHPEIFRYLQGVLNRDEKNCYPSDADSDEKINCAYRILEIMAPVIENFPLTVDASGDLVTKDYSSALLEARDWFAQHPDYTISRSSF